MVLVRMNPPLKTDLSRGHQINLDMHALVTDLEMTNGPHVKVTRVRPI